MFQEFPGGAVIQVFCEMPAEPSPAGIPEKILSGAGGRGGVQPDVGVVMHAPSIGVIQFPGSFNSMPGHITDESEQWFRAFCQICAFSRPVVHFQIDIGDEFTSPWGVPQGIPYALQIGG